MAWIWDNSHDVVLAHLVEAAQKDYGLDDELLDDWRVWASIQDVALTYPRDQDVEATLMRRLLESARKRIVAHGDLHPRDLTDGSVLSGEHVSGGFLRTELLPIEAVLDAVDGLTDLVARTLKPEPQGTAWYLGHPNGRTTIAMRNRGGQSGR